MSLISIFDFRTLCLHHKMAVTCNAEQTASILVKCLHFHSTFALIYADQIPLKQEIQCTQHSVKVCGYKVFIHVVSNGTCYLLLPIFLTIYSAGHD